MPQDSESPTRDRQRRSHLMHYECDQATAHLLHSAEPQVRAPGNWLPAHSLTPRTASLADAVEARSMTAAGLDRPHSRAWQVTD